MKRLENFRAARKLRSLNLIAQSILVVGLFAAINYLAASYSWRFDLTQNRLYSLSAETRSYLARLNQPVTAVIAFPEDAEEERVQRAFRDVSGLLREYAHATEKNGAGTITVERLNVFQQRSRAAALGVDRQNVVLFVSGDKSRMVSYEDLYRFENGEIRAFQGERAFTAAILDVTSAEKSKIYFLSGHGEKSPDDVDSGRGLSQMRDALRQRNFVVETLNLVRQPRIPEDAALLVIVSPQGSYRPQEEELLRRYLTAGAGRLIVMLDPGVDHGLNHLLGDWGLVADDVVVLDTSRQFLLDGGDLILTDFGEHPITGFIRENRLAVILGVARAVRPDPALGRDGGLRVTPLLSTSSTAWGERSYRQGGALAFDPEVDLPGPLSLAAVSERVSAANLPFSVRGGRLIAFGASDLIANDRIANLGNLSLFIHAVNWALDQDAHLNIPPRAIERFQLSLSQQELAQLHFGLLFGLPGSVALLGLLVYWRRRT